MPHITPAMHPPAAASAAGCTGTPVAVIQPLADINGLRMSGIFPTGHEPSIRTLRE